jgi:hypothetical protein
VSDEIKQAVRGARNGNYPVRPSSCRLPLCQVAAAAPSCTLWLLLP